MLRLTELRLPLEHGDAGVARRDRRPARRRRRGRCARSRSSGAATTRARRRRSSSSTRSTARSPTKRRCSPATPAIRTCGPPPTPLPPGRPRTGRLRCSGRPRPIVVGFGPCGIFAALVLAQMGLRPLVLERGSAVRERTGDTWGLWRRGVLDPESNVQFGEGGAGTFSDGKLWSQISDPRHLTRKVHRGIRRGRRARGDPLRRQAAHRHVPPGRRGRAHAPRDRAARRRGPLRRARRRPAHRGRRGARRRRSATGARQIDAEHVVIAPGHSARDTFAMLHARGVHLEAEAVLDRLSHRAPAVAHRPARASARAPAIRSSAPPTTGSSTTRRTAAPSTASACARAAPSSPRRRSPGASSPTA